MDRASSAPWTWTDSATEELALPRGRRAGRVAQPLAEDAAHAHRHRGVGHHHLLELVPPDLGDLGVAVDDGGGGARLPGEEGNLAEEPAGTDVLHHRPVLGLERHLAREDDVEGLAEISATEEDLAGSLGPHDDALGD